MCQLPRSFPYLSFKLYDILDKTLFITQRIYLGADFAVKSLGALDKV